MAVDCRCEELDVLSEGVWVRAISWCSGSMEGSSYVLELRASVVEPVIVYETLDLLGEQLLIELVWVVIAGAER